MENGTHAGVGGWGQDPSRTGLREGEETAGGNSTLDWTLWCFESEVHTFFDTLPLEGEASCHVVRTEASCAQKL